MYIIELLPIQFPVLWVSTPYLRHVSQASNVHPWVRSNDPIQAARLVALSHGADTQQHAPSYQTTSLGPGSQTRLKRQVSNITFVGLCLWLQGRIQDF